jgi:GxxExxY protein
MGELDYEVMRHAFAAYKELGCLCDESVYQHRLAQLLSGAGIEAEREIAVTLRFRDYVKQLYLDLVVNRQTIYELKTVSLLTAAHRAQLLNYLFLANATRGKLVNFRPASVESEFVNALLDCEVRRQFDADASQWSGPEEFRRMVIELVTDWGTGLDHNLYHQAIVGCLGGEETVTRQIPMQADGLPLGNQRFHLLRDDAAFQITTFQENLGASYRKHIERLVQPSPLREFHWVNIARHQLSFVSIAI